MQTSAQWVYKRKTRGSSEQSLPNDRWNTFSVPLPSFRKKIPHRVVAESIGMSTRSSQLQSRSVLMNYKITMFKLAHRSFTSLCRIHTAMHERASFNSCNLAAPVQGAFYGFARTKGARMDGNKFKKKKKRRKNTRM